MPKKDSKQKIKIILLFFFGNLMVFFSFKKWKLYKKFIISKQWSVHWSRKKYNFFFYVFSQNNFTRWCEPTKRDCSLTVCGLSSVLIVPISCLYFDTVLCSCTRYFFRTRFVFGLECFNKFFFIKKNLLYLQGSLLCPLTMGMNWSQVELDSAIPTLSLQDRSTKSVER